MDTTVKISGKKLATLRRLRFMSQEEVSRELKISKSRVSAIEALDETGVYLKNFKNLASLFKMPPEDLRKELTLDGLKARAALEKSTLDEWLARQATFSVEVHDDPTPPASQGRRVKSQKRGTAKGRHPKRPESPDKSNLQCIQ